MWMILHNPKSALAVHILSKYKTFTFLAVGIITDQRWPGQSTFTFMNNHVKSWGSAQILRWGCPDPILSTPMVVPFLGLQRGLGGAAPPKKWLFVCFQVLTRTHQEMRWRTWTFTQCAPEATGIRGNNAKWRSLRRSRSFKVTDFGTNRKLIYDFLLVLNSNLSPILHSFRDIAVDRSKIAVFGYPSCA